MRESIENSTIRISRQAQANWNATRFEPVIFEQYCETSRPPARYSMRACDCLHTKKTAAERPLLGKERVRNTDVETKMHAQGMNLSWSNL